MRSLDELTMYAGGLLDPAETEGMERHLDGCSACADMVRRLRSERRALEQAAERRPSSPPPALLEKLAAARRKRPLPKLTRAGAAAAALMLAGLVWLLARAPAPAVVEPAVPTRRPPQSTDEHIDRLVAALQGVHREQREAAALALPVYGGLALEKLEKIHAEAALLDRCRGIRPADRALMDKLDQLRITIDVQNAPFTAFVDQLRGITQLNLHISGIDNPQDRLVTSRHVDAPASDVLRRAVRTLGEEYGLQARDGVVIVGPIPAPAASVPVRPPASAESGHALIPALGHVDPARRDQAFAQLRRLGIAAEPALWDGVASPVPEIRARAAELVRSLYAGKQEGPQNPEPAALGSRVDFSFEDKPLIEILEALHTATGLSMVLCNDLPEGERKVTFKVKDLLVKNTLKLLLSQFRLDCVPVGGLLLIEDPHHGHLARLRSEPLWTDPKGAKEIEERVGRISRGDVKPPSEELPRPPFPRPEPILLDALYQASRILPVEEAERCRAALEHLGDAHQLWYLNVPCGVDLQKPTEREKTLLSRKVSPTGADTVRRHLEKLGIPFDLRSGGEDTAVLFVSDAPLEAALKVLLRPRGLDFYVERETIVVDTAAKVRELLRVR